MTIISDRYQNGTQEQRQGRSRSSGVSFAERIEAGSSAKQITQDRALSFSETGLLGLHYAHNLSNKNSVHSTRQNSQIEGNTLVAGNGLHKRIATNAPTFMHIKINIVPFADNSAGPPKANTDLLKNKQNLTQPILDHQAFVFDVTDQTGLLLPGIAKSFQKALYRKGIRSRTALQIIETPEGISVLFEDQIFSNCSLEEFAELAHQIAKDFNVTVSNLVVNKK